VAQQGVYLGAGGNVGIRLPPTNGLGDKNEGARETMGERGRGQTGCGGKKMEIKLIKLEGGNVILGPTRCGGRRRGCTGESEGLFYRRGDLVRNSQGERRTINTAPGVLKKSHLSRNSSLEMGGRGGGVQRGHW